MHLGTDAVRSSLLHTTPSSFTHASGVHADVLGVAIAAESLLSAIGGDFDVLVVVAVTPASLSHLSGEQQSNLLLPAVGGRFDVLGVVAVTAAFLSHVSGEQQSNADCKHLARGGDCSRLV